MKTLRIILADDHALVRAGFRALLPQLMRHLGIQDAAGLVRFANQMGLVTPEE